MKLEEREQMDREVAVPVLGADGCEHYMPKQQLAGARAALDEAPNPDDLAALPSPKGESSTSGGGASSSEASKRGRTAMEWAALQGQFVHLPPLPQGWIRVISQSTGRLYYFNMFSGETTFNEPMDLPPGWTQMKSRSTGKVYYWNAALKKSQFERPTAEARADARPTTEASGLGLEGLWIRPEGNMLVQVTATELIWPGGLPRTPITHCEGKLHMVNDGETYVAELIANNSKLSWSDGEVWEREART